MTEAAAQPSAICVGTAGWAIPGLVADRFGEAGTQLQRYANALRCTEINSSFRREHRAATYARWAAATPPGFRFAVKLPHRITHEGRLERVVAPLERFLDAVGELGDRLGPLLVQLPPSLACAPRIASTFFGVLRRRFDGAVVCEPRDASWFDDAAERMLIRYRIGRVAADPARVPAAARPGGWLGDSSKRGVAYFRWHGSPRVYWSSYGAERIGQWAADVQDCAERSDCWCIFDNTASGAAAPNALELVAELARRR
ncbi:MAG: DUF72 domain-containing protein [Caldimonas sp.]